MRPKQKFLSMLIPKRKFRTINYPALKVVKTSTTDIIRIDAHVIDKGDISEAKEKLKEEIIKRIEPYIEYKREFDAEIGMLIISAYVGVTVKEKNNAD